MNQDRMYTLIYNTVGLAVSNIAHLDKEWSEADISKRIVRHVYKAASDPELLKMPWEQSCQELVVRAMNGYSASCGEKPWFYDIDLVRVFTATGIEMVNGTGQAFNPNGIHEIMEMEYQDKLDRRLLDKAIWEVVSAFFLDDKVKGKVFTALSKSYWPALDAVLMDGNMHRDILHGLDAQTDQRRIEAFTRRWMDDAMSRAWAVLEISEGGLEETTLVELLKALICPFGEEDPFSCLPGALTERLGRPPMDWAYVRQCVKDLFRQWNEGASAPSKNNRKRKNKSGGGVAQMGEEEVAEEEPEDFDLDDTADAVAAAPPQVKKKKAAAAGAGAGATVASKMAAYRKRQRSSPFSAFAPAETKEEAEDEELTDESLVPEEQEEVPAGEGCPECTSQDDCIGSATDRLMRHMHNGKAGDLYCEPCWESFRQRNPNLTGVFADEEE